VVILCGDVPLIKAGTVRALIKSHGDEKRDLSVLAVELENPTGYGRILLDETVHFHEHVHAHRHGQVPHQHE
jgi:bifunctional N-acetylglucosamine-1-phosphate-uridyltransferase/glucosamine-1-phosphate-acetyltransferase GlmU-like protein